MKCVDCNTKIPEEKSEKELKIEFNNPGTVFLKAHVMECPKCSSKYSDEKDTLDILDRIEVEYNHKNS